MENEQNLYNKMPLIGDEAPAFEAITTQGNIKYLKIIKENG